ncbi:Putative zincin peptidase [Halogranum gelatinilyticum]|uniref:Putative zincin peptidase n=1 Tax=Halogranum gelatinilyticum TaxID=660521 RepID=A0A1G9PFA0_9EURY|nr:DUF3267 domain-containing protein [Halogranum gelatinilyticum]SDL97429.1 Putative zincin peptidase [Halogranum gelatinilyticum]
MSSDSRTPLTTFTVSRQTALEWTGLGTAGFVVALFVLGGLYGVVHGTASLGVNVDAENVGGVAVGGLVLLVLSAGLIVVHELLHGVAMKRYGGDPRYGAGIAHFVLPYAYATSDTEFTRNQFIVIALVPLVVITAVGVPVMLAFDLPILLVPLALNVGGAVGDLWMVRLLLRYPADVDVHDDVTGLRVFGDAEFAPVDSPRTVLRSSLVGFGVVLGLSFLAAMLAPMLLDIAGVTSLSLGPAGTPWSLLQFESGPDGFSSTFGLGGLLGLSAAAGLAYGLLTAGRGRRRSA